MMSGKIPRLRLHVLRKSDERRPGSCRVEHRRHRGRQGLNDLFGAYDAIPVANNWLERIVDGD
jgi:hypothetical protein